MGCYIEVPRLERERLENGAFGVSEGGMLTLLLLFLDGSCRCVCHLFRAVSFDMGGVE